MKILVGDAMPGDSLFLHCKSGFVLLNFPDSFNIQSLDMADKYPTWMGTKQTVWMKVRDYRWAGVGTA